ncbi:MAG: hypothetical protein ACREDT_15145 [Methylocella sp.]
MSDEKGENLCWMPVEIAREIARQGDVRLSAMMSLATAADLRATTLCGIFGASSVAVGAAVLTDIASEHPMTRAIIGGAILAIGLFLAAFTAAFAGAPRDFYVGGGSPDSLRDWCWANGKWRDETEMLDATGNRYAQSIAKNGELLEMGSKLVRRALWIAFASPVVGALAFFVVPLLPSFRLPS